MHAVSLRSVCPIWALLAAAAMTGAAGCGPGRPSTCPVQGKVVFADGKPLAGGLIELESMPAEGPPFNASGRIQPDGSFRLGTFQEGDGAVAGKHRAIVRPLMPEVDIEQGIKPSEPVIDPKFERYETSGLELTVTEGENEWTVRVERPPAKTR